MARDRHSALRDGDHGRRHRGRTDGPAAGRGDAVRGLRLVRLGPSRHDRRQAALARRHARAVRAPVAVGRRLLGRAVPLAESRVVVRAHPRPEVRLSGDAGGREGADHLRDRGSEPGAVLRAQASVPADQGRGSGGALHGADRQSADPHRGHRRDRDHLGRDGLHGRGSSRTSRCVGRDRRSAQRDAVGQAGGARLGAQDVEGARAARGHADRAGSAARSPPRSPRRRSRISTRRCAGSLRPTRRSRSRRCSRRHSSHRSRTSPVGSRSSSSTRRNGHVYGNRSRRRDAPDGRLRLGGHGHEVAQAGGRARRGRRDPARDLHRQGRHRGPVARLRHRQRDPRHGGRDRRRRHRARAHRRRDRDGRRPPPPSEPEPELHRRARAPAQPVAPEPVAAAAEPAPPAPVRSSRPRTARRSSRRSSPASPASTASTRPRCRAPGPADA